MKLQAYEQLERDWAAWVGCYSPEQVVACSSGTAALHLALEAFQLPACSEVVVPDFTMIACPRAVALAGLTPVFVDCNHDLLIDLDLLERPDFGGWENVKAIMPVHVYGRKVDTDWLAAYWPVKNGVKIVEDLAEAHWIKPHKAADAACYSFYANKVIAGEEGGAVAFKDPKHAALARELRSLGFTAKHDFWHTPRGHNYRMSNAHAKLILKSLDRAGLNKKIRDELVQEYDAACPDEWRLPERQTPWVYDVRVPGLTEAKQEAVVKALNEAGIAARHPFRPCHRQQEFIYCRLVYHEGPRAKPGVKCDKFICLPEEHPHHYTTEPNSAIFSREVFYLPLTPGKVKPADCKRAFEIIHSVLEVEK